MNGQEQFSCLWGLGKAYLGLEADGTRVYNYKDVYTEILGCHCLSKNLHRSG